MRVAAILPAAGMGTRMGKSRKQFLLLDGAPVMIHTVRKFAACPLIDEIVVALPAADLEWAGALLRTEVTGKIARVVEGGNSRQESVENALRSLDPATDLVAVHDAVRPFIDAATLEHVIREAAETGAAIVGIVPVDTVKRVSKAQNSRARISATIPRDRLVLAQTPQVFRFGLLKKAFAEARKDGFTGTDEASLVERLDEVEVTVVPGSDRNIKITKPSDMDLARLFLAEEHKS